MKAVFTLFLFTALNQVAFAHPGSNKTICRSSKYSSSKQKIELSLMRPNGLGWASPVIEVKIDDKKVLLDTPDEMSFYGKTFHDSPLKVILVTADVASDEEGNNNSGYFDIAAMPASVRAYDINNRPVKWSMKNEKDECYDTNGRATFKGIIHGSIRADKTYLLIDPQILDCELTYNSGMQC